MNIVTGYRGFIGSHICDNVANIFGVEKDDCFDFLKDFKDWSNVKFIYHLGAITDTTCTDVEKIYKYNIEFSLRLFEKAIKHQIPIRYASSASVYGNTHGSINPLNYYSMSKATIDLWVQDNISRFKHIQGLRFFNVYGNGEEHKNNQASPVTKFKKDAQETRTISIFEESEFYYRDFICVEDVVQIMQKNTLGSGIYDVGTGNPISFKTVAKLIQRKYGGEIKVIPFPKHLEGKYQTSTKARQVFQHTFKNLSQWLEESNH
jgi:ADP-L-glycero-D-manno-heptose 6-epimerase